MALETAIGRFSKNPGTIQVLRCRFNANSAVELDTCMKII
jgi:hypothetical protein